MASTDAERRVYLTDEEAIARLPEKPRIHTFLGGGIALIGADWDRADVIEASGPPTSEVQP